MAIIKQSGIIAIKKIPRDGWFYATASLLAGEPDVNFRTIRRWPSEEQIVRFNGGLNAWTAEHQWLLDAALAALNALNDLDVEKILEPSANKK